MTPASLLPPSPAVGPLALRPQQLSAGNGDRRRPEVTSQPAPSLSPGLGQAHSSYQLLSAAAELCSRASTGHCPPPRASSHHPSSREPLGRGLLWEQGPIA